LHARKLTRPKTPAEAALCFEPRANTVTRICHPNMPDLAIASCTRGRPMQDRDRCRLDVGWARLRASLPSYRWASRCRMRGARGDLHSPNDAWTPQPHGQRSGKIGAGWTQRRRLSVRAASQPRSDRGFASRSTGSADRVRHYAACIVTKIRATKRVFRGGRSTRRPRFTPSRKRRLDSDASSKAARRRRRTTLPLGHVDAGPSSWRAGRLTPPPWEQRMRAE
jgi:hypothetical protein